MNLISNRFEPYGRLIASLGQTDAQVPPSEIASTGHSSIHVPQAIQSLPIT